LAAPPSTNNPDYRVYVYDGTLERALCYSTPLGNPGDIRPEPKMTKQDIANMIKSIGVNACQANVASEYVNEAADNNPILLVAAFPRLNALPEPAGFVMCAPQRHMRKNTTRTVMYLDVICAKSESRIGGRLVDHFIKFSNMKSSPDGSPAFQAIKLSSLASVLSFYPSKGFEFRKHCGDDAKVIEIPQSFHDMIKRYKTEKKALPTTCAKAHSIPEYRELMRLLHKEGFTVKTTDGCDNRSISWTAFKKGVCDNDGFVMMRCRKPTNTSERLNYGSASEEKSLAITSQINDSGYNAAEEEAALRKYAEDKAAPRGRSKVSAATKAEPRQTRSRVAGQTRKRSVEPPTKVETRRTRTKRTKTKQE